MGESIKKYIYKSSLKGNTQINLASKTGKHIFFRTLERRSRAAACILLKTIGFYFSMLQPSDAQLKSSINAFVTPLVFSSFLFCLRDKKFTQSKGGKKTSFLVKNQRGKINCAYCPSNAHKKKKRERENRIIIYHERK